MEATTTVKPWFEVKNTSNTAIEIYVMGTINDEQWANEDVTPGWFKDELEKVKDARHIHLFVNSDGGSVFAALAIHNMIKNSKAFVTSHVLGIVASAASWMIMPSDKIVMPKNAFMMLHLPATLMFGNKNDFRKTADYLDRVENIIVESYLRGGKKLTEDKVRNMLNAGETWLDGQQAYDVGLVDFVEPPVSVANKGDYVTFNGFNVDISKFESLPVMPEIIDNDIKTYDEEAMKYYVERANSIRNRILTSLKG